MGLASVSVAANDKKVGNARVSQTAPTADAPAARPPAFSTGYKGMVLSLLLTAYVFNFIDRTILSTIGQAVKEDLRVTDAQLGLLGGLYFALLYTMLGIPIARLAERYSRTWIITISLVIWSGFTAMSGMAHSYVQLALMRFGVGVGEAGLSPPAHSLISDFYEPRKRASALSIFSLGIPLGTMVGAVVGGWLAQEFSWRVAFVCVGLPGVLLALAFRLLVKEPARGASDIARDPPPAYAEEVVAPPERRGLGAELRETGAVAAILFGKWPVFNMVMGITIASFAGYGMGAFIPPHFIRNFGLGLAQTGLVYGLLQGASAGLGTLLGGFMTDALGKRSARWYALLPAIGTFVAAPLYMLSFNQADWKTTAMIFIVPGVFAYTYLAPTFAVVQNSVPVTRRATATAILFFFLNLIALGGGPPIAGWLIDHLGAWNFTHPGAHDAWTSLTGSLGGASDPAYGVACPGGMAPKGSAAAATATCKATLGLSTRQGVTIMAAFYAWAGVHYALAAFGMVKHMRERALAAG